jgi:hypothetical protein
MEIVRRVEINVYSELIRPSRPWAVVRKSAWKSNFVATPWGIDFLWFKYHRCSITTKSSQAKNLPNTEKMGDSDYPLLNCITAKKCEILYSITTQMTSIIGKLTKNWIYKTFKQFFYISNCFRIIRCQKRVFT